MQTNGVCVCTFFSLIGSLFFLFVCRAVEDLELSDSQDVHEESEQPVDDNAEELDR